uniref:AMP-binding domain-containing protein n=1 Tax=Angiostrongylus cantonensis TaxID=6313 RepID=A0A0K0D4S1_ANGCA
MVDLLAPARVTRRPLQVMQVISNGDLNIDVKRGVPGAWATLNGQKVSVFGSTRWRGAVPPPGAREIEVAEVPQKKLYVHDAGLLLSGSDGHWVNVDTIKIGSKTMPANKFGLAEEKGEKLAYTEEEIKVVEIVKVYMAPTFCENAETVIKKLRGGDNIAVVYDAVGFVLSRRWENTINPNDESIICQIPKADINDVNKAVEAAKAVCFVRIFFSLDSQLRTLMSPTNPRTSFI